MKESNKESGTIRRIVVYLLVNRLDRAAKLLRSHGVDFWADWLEGDLARLVWNHPTAIPHLRSAFGGMGSLTDVSIDPRNGHRIAPDDVERVNGRLQRLTAQIYMLVSLLGRFKQPEEAVSKVPSHKPSNEPTKPSAPKPELVQAWDFTREHFERHPVWVSCHVEDYDEPWYEDTDEATMRPWTGPLPAEPSVGGLEARATCILADGTRLDGSLTPAAPGESGQLLATMQPTMFLPDGSLVFFWEGSVKQDEQHARLYRALGKSAAEIFPIQCAALEGLVGGISRCTVDGFYSTPDGATVRLST